MFGQVVANVTASEHRVYIVDGLERRSNTARSPLFEILVVVDLVKYS